MTKISKSGIAPHQQIKAEHLTRIIDALIGESPNTQIEISGSVTASYFIGDGSQLTNLPFPSGSGSVTNQDNILIVKRFNLPTGTVGIRQPHNLINNSPSFILTESQSMMVTAVQRKNLQEPSFIQKFMYINKGKGTYGTGSTVTDINDYEVVFSNQVSSQDYEEFESTQIIDLGWNITGTTIYSYVNALNPSITFQSQSMGYVITKVINSGSNESYLFLGEGGVYGSGSSQTTGSDFQLLQDNPSSVPDVSATISGIVNNIPLQELGGVDKTINGIRIGKGSGSLSSNTAFGSGSLRVTTGNFNDAFGAGALTSNTSGQANTALGSFSLFANTTGAFNTAVGGNALAANTTGMQNAALGQSALAGNIIGGRNVAMGVASQLSNVSGSFNTAAGNNTLRLNVSGSRNTVLGANAGSNVRGSNNVLIGGDSTSDTTGISTGNDNILVGRTVTGITTGSFNTVLGKPTGLNAGTSNHIIIADGSGSIGFIKNNLGEITSPNLTKALILSGGSRSLATNEFVMDAIASGSSSSSATLQNVVDQDSNYYKELPGGTGSAGFFSNENSSFSFFVGLGEDDQEFSGDIVILPGSSAIESFYSGTRSTVSVTDRPRILYTPYGGNTNEYLVPSSPLTSSNILPTSINGLYAGEDGNIGVSLGSVLEEDASISENTQATIAFDKFFLISGDVEDSGLITISNLSSSVQERINLGIRDDFNQLKSGLQVFNDRIILKDNNGIGIQYDGDYSESFTSESLVTNRFVQQAITGSRPYNVYTALLSQTGTDDPTAIELENTIGTISITRDASGSYRLGSDNKFTNNKTLVFLQNYLFLNKHIAHIGTTTAEVSIITENIGNLEDDILSGTPIEIRVYN